MQSVGRFVWITAFRQFVGFDGCCRVYAHLRQQSSCRRVRAQYSVHEMASGQAKRDGCLREVEYMSVAMAELQQMLDGEHEHGFSRLAAS